MLSGIPQFVYACTLVKWFDMQFTLVHFCSKAMTSTYSSITVVNTYRQCFKEAFVCGIKMEKHQRENYGFNSVRDQTHNLPNESQYSYRLVYHLSPVYSVDGITCHGTFTQVSSGIIQRYHLYHRHKHDTAYDHAWWCQSSTILNFQGQRCGTWNFKWTFTVREYKAGSICELGVWQALELFCTAAAIVHCVGEPFVPQL